jgi:hypothetical protein
MPMGKRIGAARAVAVAAVLCGTAMVGTVHEGLAGELPLFVFKPSTLPPKPPPGASARVLGAEPLPLPPKPRVFGTTGKDEVRLPPTSPSLLNEVQKYHLIAKVHDLYAQAGPGINTKINDAHGALTKRQVESVVNNELVSTITERTKEPGSDISFEILTGKLKIQKVKTVRGVNISGGEVNIYKISEILAGIIYACEKLSTPQFSNCVDAAVAEVRAIVIKEIGENDAVAGSNGRK